MLNAEQAKALHSDAGIQFFRRDGKDYRKVNYVGAGYGDWLTPMVDKQYTRNLLFDSAVRLLKSVK
ncbi:MAG: hypothetical protein P8X74_13015 [Reinekea sp.]